MQSNTLSCTFIAEYLTKSSIGFANYPKNITGLKLLNQLENDE